MAKRTKYNLKSTGLVYMPGMVENYRRACVVNDDWFKGVFEGMWDDIPASIFPALAAGDYVVMGDDVHVVIDVEGGA